MQRKTFSNMQCPVARSLERVVVSGGASSSSGTPFTAAETLRRIPEEPGNRAEHADAPAQLRWSKMVF